jgi:pimeloyl-ACP methyl ester carboxylesterase
MIRVISAAHAADEARDRRPALMERGRFTDRLGLGRYTLFMQDYGGPIGFRLATAHPARVRALVVQNAVVHEDGLGPLWDTRRAFWADRTAHEAALRENFFSPSCPGSAGT